MDGEGGGRLIYYDFGMMGVIPSDIRSGLLELFYGVYEKDPDRCIEALIRMGVLVPTTDRTAVRRTAVFFLNNFQVHRSGRAHLRGPLCNGQRLVQLAHSILHLGQTPASQRWITCSCCNVILMLVRAS